MEKKKIYLMEIACLVCFTFILGYNVGLVKSNKIIKSSTGAKDSYSSTVNVNKTNVENAKSLNKVVPEKADIIFKMQCSQGNGSKCIIERTKKAKDEEIVGKKGSEIEQKYKSLGYMLKNIDGNVVEMIRKPIVYDPNVYVLICENNEIVIAHTNEKGSAFDKDGNIIERQGTGAKIECLREQDISNVLKGDKCIQFKNNSDLNDGIQQFDIKYEMPE